MPERVHTRFDNDETPPPVQAPVAQPAKKRKAEEAFRSQAVPAQPPSQPKVVTFHDKQEQEALLKRKSSGGGQSANVKGRLKQRALDLLPGRRSLPIFQHADEIRNALRKQDALLLVGETGSGKSTQVPQFLFNEAWCKSTSVPYVPVGGNTAKANGGPKTIRVGGCIAITQPRRVAAISLARRVAEEMGTPLGSSSPASQVGYSVRFDNSTSPSTRIKFLTEGMLLQEMLRDPWLKEYSAVIVDEVHERGVNVDLVLGFLKQMNDGKKEGRGGIGMKLVVMSATADMEKIQEFFDQSHSAVDSGVNGLSNGNTDGRKDEDEESDSSSAWSGFSDNKSDGSSKMASNVTTGSAATESKALPVALCHIKGRQHPVQTFYTPTPVADWVDAAFQRVLDIHLHQPLPGDILVFLTGQETVESLESLLNDYAHMLLTTKDPKLKGVPKLLILPLFAALPQHAQQHIFNPTPHRTRKVILATNIAETSITVPGIRHVIDSGKHKRKQYRSRLNLDSLLVKPISKSSANQRKGRAGREAPGTCYRLYTESDYLQLPQDNDPEILRCDLTQVVLTLKARGVNDNILAFPWLTPPRRAPLEQALIQLLNLGALSRHTGHIAALGQSIARLPLPANLARVLLAATDAHLACLAEATDIISALSVEALFLNASTPALPDARREGIEAARRALLRREGDHLTLLATVQAYAAEPADRRRWCDERLISHRAMHAVMDVRRQLTSLMRKHHQQQQQPPDPQAGNASSTNPTPLSTRLLRAFLTGFGLNVARLTPDGSYRTLLANQAIAIHPSSVLFGRKVEAIMYHEFVWTQKGYARNVSAVEMGWIGTDSSSSGGGDNGGGEEEV